MMPDSACRVCAVPLTEANTHDANWRDGRRICKPCVSSESYKLRAQDIGKRRRQNRESYRRAEANGRHRRTSAPVQRVQRMELRDRVIWRYGGACACCGIDDFDVLTI